MLAQVVIGGRNKYLINGHSAKLNRVQNLFHSVQLNVNNPHFLIMQVRGLYDRVGCTFPTLCGCHCCHWPSSYHF